MIIASIIRILVKLFQKRQGDGAGPPHPQGGGTSRRTGRDRDR